MLTGCQVSEEPRVLCRDYLRVSLPLMHHLGASRHHQLCQGVDVITLMFVSVGENGCIQTAAQVNITYLSVI